MVGIMIKSDILQPLDMSKIPNFENVGENFKGLPYDPNNEYSVPYQWGTTGILTTRRDRGASRKLGSHVEPGVQGKIGMLNDVRETMGAALYRLGYSVNTTNSDQLDEAEAALKEQKPLLRGYFDSASGNRPLVQKGELWLGHVFSGDAFVALSENPDLDYIVPKPRRPAGRTTWLYRRGGASDNAHKFINYILDAKVGAALTNYTYYNTPNEAAVPMLDEALTELPGYRWHPRCTTGCRSYRI